MWHFNTMLQFCGNTETIYLHISSNQVLQWICSHGSKVFSSAPGSTPVLHWVKHNQGASERFPWKSLFPFRSEAGSERATGSQKPARLSSEACLPSPSGSSRERLRAHLWCHIQARSSFKAFCLETAPHSSVSFPVDFTDTMALKWAAGDFGFFPS